MVQHIMIKKTLRCQTVKRKGIFFKRSEDSTQNIKKNSVLECTQIKIVQNVNFYRNRPDR